MPRPGIASRSALRIAAALIAAIFLAPSAHGQIGRAHIPPIKPRPYRVDVALIEWADARVGADFEAVAQLLESEAQLPPTLRVATEVSGYAIRSYTFRIPRDERPDLLLTLLGRDRRRVRLLLEEEDAPAREALTLRLRLDRSYGAARGRLVEPLGPRGPWLRVDLHRP